MRTRIPVLEEASERLQAAHRFRSHWRAGADSRKPISSRTWPSGVSPSRCGCAAAKSSTTWSNPTCSTISSVTCRCSRTRCSRTSSRRMARSARMRASPAALKMLARLYWYTVEFGLVRNLARPARLRRGHSLLERRNHLRHQGHWSGAYRLRSAARAAHQLPDRRVPEDLFRAGRHRTAVRQRARRRLRVAVRAGRSNRPTRRMRACRPTSRSLSSLPPLDARLRVAGKLPRSHAERPRTPNPISAVTLRRIDLDRGGRAVLRDVNWRIQSGTALAADRRQWRRQDAIAEAAVGRGVAQAHGRTGCAATVCAAKVSTRRPASPTKSPMSARSARTATNTTSGISAPARWSAPGCSAPTSPCAS